MHIREINYRLLLGVLSILMLFGVGLSHIGSVDSMGMMSANQHVGAAQCQNLCNATFGTTQSNRLIHGGIEDKNPLPIYGEMLSYGALLLLFIFVINRLYLLSSWRPPDLVITHGLYRSGL